MLRFAILIVVTGMLAPAASAASYCPGAIATVTGAGLNSILLPKLETLYRQLGCELTVLPFPGRRGVVEFNAGNVSGELYRLPVIEGSYTVDFVRSAVPVLEVQQSIWTHPKRELSEDSVIGYTIGRKWQEDVAASESDRYRFVEYSTSGEMLDDFTRFGLDGFLASLLAVDALVKDGNLSEMPVMARLIGVTQVYHYLEAGHTPFMTDLSGLIGNGSSALNTASTN
ncbi:hypothetical protein [Roseibium sp. M-1]